LLAALAALAPPAVAQSAAHRAGPTRAAPPAVTDTGGGPETFVLLTGLVGGVGGFGRIREPLVARGYRVVAVDPYHLSLDSADVTFAALARRVDRVLAARGVTAAHVVGHAHGGGVALRLAAAAPERVAAVYLLDVGAQANNRGPVLGSTLRLVPLITRVPGGRRFVRARFVAGLRRNSARHDWLDEPTQRNYTEPTLDAIGRVVAMAVRLGRSEEPEPLPAVIARVRVPVVLLLGGVASPAGPSTAELAALTPLGPRLRVQRLPGVAHFPHEEAPGEVVRHLVGAQPQRPGVTAPHRLPVGSDHPRR
jgi:pimeloyl-ACP methyl ester carboxylesterase